jgi:hypothetical protein
MNKTVSKQVRKLIKTISGCDKLSVPRSTLIGNDDWVAYGDAALKADAKQLNTKRKELKQR